MILHVPHDISQMYYIHGHVYCTLKIFMFSYLLILAVVLSNAIIHTYAHDIVSLAISQYCLHAAVCPVAVIWLDHWKGLCVTSTLECVGVSYTSQDLCVTDVLLGSKC